MSNTTAHTTTLAAFDAAAANYDAHFSFSKTGMLQRKRVRHFLKKQATTIKDSHVLELNCGTGEDALWLAGNGAYVTATDLAGNMIEQLKNKLSDVSELNIKAMQCAFDELEQKLTDNNYSFVFSNFGGLNCINSNEMMTLAATLHRITAKEAQLALVVMPKSCWWEKMYFWLKRNKEAAIRRQNSNAVDTTFGSNTLPVWYYTPADIAMIFSAGFTKMYQKPIGFFLPPSYMEAYFIKRKWVLKFLYGLEKLMGHCSFLAPYSDHYLIVLKKKQTI